MQTGSAVLGAMADWEQLLGSEHVLADQTNLQAAGTATFATTQAVVVILRPADTAQVQECLRIAQRHRVPVYPVSGGKNWGYGSRVPPVSGCALLDLARLNRITELNPDLAYVTIEPGVTQHQLYQYLQQHAPHLWMDATGSSGHTSVLGNIVERGFGHSPYGDRFQNVCGFEVVLPNGECIHTGFARFPNAQTAPLYRWGIGPSLDGLFSQSNLGVVTRMTVWLMPKPEYLQGFFFKTADPDAIAGIVDALRPLRLDGTIRSALHIGNDYKVLGGTQQYPWDRTNGETPLRPQVMAELRREFGIGAWTASGALYGSVAQVAASRERLEQALAGKVDQLQFIDEELLAAAARPGSGMERIVGLLRPLFGLVQGIPTEHSLRGAYWRKRTPVPEMMDPDRDGCGLLWLAPVVPTDGRHVVILEGLLREVMLRHGYEPMLSMTMLVERAMACVVSIIYDRAVAGEDQRAAACHRELQQRFADHGYYPYRLGINAMQHMGGEGAYAELLQSFKRAVDPHNVLAPGRYEFREYESRNT